MRGAPQSILSMLIPRIRARRPVSIGGRAPRFARWPQLQNFFAGLFVPNRCLFIFNVLLLQIWTDFLAQFRGTRSGPLFACLIVGPLRNCFVSDANAWVSFAMVRRRDPELKPLARKFTRNRYRYSRLPNQEKYQQPHVFQINEC